MIIRHAGAHLPCEHIWGDTHCLICHERRPSQTKVRLHLRHVHGFSSFGKLVDTSTHKVLAVTQDRGYKHTWSVYRDAHLLAVEKGWILLPEYES